jgi:hypothetical protein
MTTLNIDKPGYQRLAKEILVYRDCGLSWADAQRRALEYLAIVHNWRPS